VFLPSPRLRALIGLTATVPQYVGNDTTLRPPEELANIQPGPQERAPRAKEPLNRVGGQRCSRKDNVLVPVLDRVEVRVDGREHERAKNLLEAVGAVRRQEVFATPDRCVGHLDE
jgi:hypothetical protein